MAEPKSLADADPDPDARLDLDLDTRDPDEGAAARATGVPAIDSTIVSPSNGSSTCAATRLARRPS